ncbi:MAG: phosphoglucosamine mutase [Eubacteriales bacterium]|nr:phosphoglucosamine mutase [Eubacteriales bacterium]
MGRLFGTDGIRGIANEGLTCELAMQIGRATAQVLLAHSRRRPLFVVGMDTRLSSDMLSCALVAGLCSVGADVYQLGYITTPAVAYLVGKYKADAGVMISASHNSAEFNGIKIFSGDGFKLPDELEEQIESLILKQDYPYSMKTGLDIGKVSTKTDAVKDYIAHLKSTIPTSLEGVSLAVDCANGAASFTARRLFQELGADCHILNDAPDGGNINLACGSTHLEGLIQYVRENQLDIGVAFDGDADRCLCVDGDGNMVDGDFIIAICALDMKKRGKLARDTVVGTIMSNMGLSRFCEDNGIHFVVTKVGDRYVLEEMLMEEYNFGGEQSGHVIFRDFATTGDGQLTAIQLLSLLKREGVSLKEAAKIMTRYPQVMENIKTTQDGKLKFLIDPQIKEFIEEKKELLGHDGRIVARVSGTEPLIRIMAEGIDLALIQTVVNEIVEMVKKQIAE